MQFKWETEEERLLRFMKMPIKKKLEWLREAHEFVVTLASSNKNYKAIVQKLREKH